MASVFIESVHRQAIDVGSLDGIPRLKPGRASAVARLILDDGTDLSVTLPLDGDEYALLHRLTEVLAERALASIRAGGAT